MTKFASPGSQALPLRLGCAESVIVCGTGLILFLFRRIHFEIMPLALCHGNLTFTLVKTLTCRPPPPFHWCRGQSQRHRWKGEGTGNKVDSSRVKVKYHQRKAGGMLSLSESLLKTEQKRQKSTAGFTQNRCIPRSPGQPRWQSVTRRELVTIVFWPLRLCLGEKCQDFSRFICGSTCIYVCFPIPYS